MRTLAITHNITLDCSVEMLDDRFDPADQDDRADQLAELAGWANSTVLSGDPVAEVRALKEAPGDDIVVTGSITLCHTLIAAGLVDEYRLFGYPVVQGRGRGLFPQGWSADRLRLVEATSFTGGATYRRYAAG